MGCVLNIATTMDKKIIIVSLSIVIMSICKISSPYFGFLFFSIYDKFVIIV